MTEIESFDAAEAPGPARNLALAVAWTLGLILGCAIVTWRVSQGGVFLGYEMNSDTLLAPAWVEDVRSHPYAWVGFQLARIPSVFPDLALQTIARAVSPDRFWGVFVYCAAQFTGLVFAAGWIVRLASGAGYLRATMGAFAVLATAVLVEAFVAVPTAVSFMWFQSCAHSGPFVLALLATGATVRLFGRWSWLQAALLFLATTAAAFSDRLVLVEFVGPSLLAMLTLSVAQYRGVPRRVRAILALIVLGALLVIPLDWLIYREGDVPVTLAGAGGRIALFAHEGPGLVLGHLPSMLILAVLPLLLFALYPILARRLESGESRHSGEVLALGPVRLRRDAALLWLNGAIAFAAVSVSTVLLVYEGPSSIRYWNGVAVWPLIFTAVVLCSLRRAILPVAAIAVAGAALALVTAATAHEARPGPAAWRSDMAACLMSRSDQYGLKTGFGDYWTARQTTFGGDIGGGAVQVQEMAQNGSALVYGSDAFDLIKSPRDPGHAPAFNYIVTAGLDEAAVRARYGAPTQTFRCEGAGASDVWVYADAPRLTRIALSEFLPPPGSYRRQCTGLVAYGELFTQCPGPGGAPRYNRLHAVNTCQGDIGVRNGIPEGDCARPFRHLRRMLTPPKQPPPG